MNDITYFYKALSDPTRLKSLLLMQHRGELCVCDLMDALELSQPKISRHLAELRRYKLVVDERRGKWVYYRINSSLTPWIKQILKITLENNVSLIQPELKRISGQRCENINN
jgi:ArsR family transcriptional regulator